MCVCVYMCICMCVYMYVCIYVYMYVCIYVYMYVCVCGFVLVCPCVAVRCIFNMVLNCPKVLTKKLKYSRNSMSWKNIFYNAIRITLIWNKQKILKVTQMCVMCLFGLMVSKAACVYRNTLGSKETGCFLQCLCDESSHTYSDTWSNSNSLHHAWSQTYMCATSVLKYTRFKRHYKSILSHWATLESHCNSYVNTKPFGVIAWYLNALPIVQRLANPI
jgi:hypothetical protein